MSYSSKKNTASRNELIAEKLDLFDFDECLSKAIEEASELLHDLVEMRLAKERGASWKEIIIFAESAAQEYADLEIAFADTFFRLLPEIKQAYTRKRNTVYNSYLPEILRKQRARKYEENAAGDGD
ncbi:MAG: hypothetical protein HGA87_02610 [Desulfobulbaceae bacterium]|nr:hypothetical protein [Desulfobulbaceae bacterium]